VKRHKATLLELCRTNEQSFFCEVRKIEFQGFGNAKASTSDKRQQSRVRNRPYRICWSELRGSSEETIDFILSKDVTGPTTLPRAAENVGGRHLVTRVLRVQRTRQAADGEQTIMALADRGGTCCPLQNRVGLYKLLGSTLGEIRETMEHICLDLVLEPHTAVQLYVTIDSVVQHDLLSFGQGCAIC
jgi:hypothetical protein